MDAQKAWDNVIRHEGETFKTVTGLDFTYEMSADNTSFKTSRTNYNLGKKNFEKAVEMMPVDTTKRLSDNGIRGQAYIFALLNDLRIIG